MMIRQKMSKPVEPIAGLEEMRQQQSVARMMIPNSTPYMRRLPKPLVELSAYLILC